MQKLRQKLNDLVLFNMHNSSILQKDYGVHIKVSHHALTITYWQDYAAATLTQQTCVEYTYMFNNLSMPTSKNAILHRVAMDAIVDYVCEGVGVIRMMDGKLTLPDATETLQSAATNNPHKKIIIGNEVTWGLTNDELKTARRKARGLPCTEFVTWFRSHYTVERDEATRFYDLVNE